MSAKTVGDATPQKKYKWRWPIYGALAGVLIFAFHLAFGPRSSPFDRLEGVRLYFAVLAVLGAGALLGVVIGFIVGALCDFNRLTPGEEVAARSIVSEQQKNAKARFNNVIARHWRGELPLWVSYWVIVFLPPFILGLLSSDPSNALKTRLSNSPPGITWYTLAVIFAVLIWQMVGAWRSARRYNAVRRELGRRAPFGVLAQLFLITVAVVSIGAGVSAGVSQFNAGTPYTIRVMQNGTEAEISGAFNEGVASDFWKILSASPQIKIVHLHSVGGFAVEGEKLFKLIREKRLDTYVSSTCMSACTFAFAGGRERFLAKGATLGFHKTDTAEGPLDRGLVNIYWQAGFEPTFINRAASAPYKDMWRPSAEVLLQARVITAVVDRSRFAPSSRDNMSEEIANILCKVLQFVNRPRQN
jgi:hypothetical protein